MIQAFRGQDPVSRHGNGRHARVGRIEGDGQGITEILQRGLPCCCRQGKGKKDERKGLPAGNQKACGHACLQWSS